MEEVSVGGFIKFSCQEEIGFTTIPRGFDPDLEFT